MTEAGERLRSAIRDAASTSADRVAFQRRVLDEIGARVPFEAACLASVDPAVLVPTSLMTVGYDDTSHYATVFDIEYGLEDDPSRFATLLTRTVPIRTLREATGGDLRASRFYTEVFAPRGVQDEVRMIFRGHDGLCWGACTLAREPGRRFSDNELTALGAALTDIGDGLRATLFRHATRMLPVGPDGPAMGIVAPDNTFESVTAAALDYFERLGWGLAGRPVVGAPAAAAASWLRNSGRESVALRACTRDGEWVIIRAGWYDVAPRRRVVMTVERAQLPEIATIAAMAHGLTRRESEVLVHLLAAESREEMARALHLSPYTVQDHLKSIYAKTGTSGRRGLVALLVRTEYLPRIGSPVGADGWFAPAS